MIGLIVAAALSTAPPVFGIELGKPLNLPECSGDLSQRPCVRKEPGMWGLVTNQAGAGTDAWLSLPVGGSTPSFLNVPAGLIDVENGVVESISLMTNGINGQEEGLRLLVAKFGKPSTVTTQAVQNRMGAHFHTIWAVWHRSGYIVKYDSAVDDLDHGEINIQTDAYAAAKAKLVSKPSL
jgi:hypothetical protein